MDNNCPCCQPPWSYQFTPAPQWSYLKIRDDNQEVVWMGSERENSWLYFTPDRSHLWLQGKDIRNLNLDGSINWSLEDVIGIKGFRLFVAPSGRLLMEHNGTLAFREPNGDLIWSMTLPLSAKGWSVDAADNLYLSHDQFPVLQKFDPAGVLIWSLDNPDFTYVLSSVPIYVGSVLVSRARRFDSPFSQDVLLFTDSSGHPIKHIDTNQLYALAAMPNGNFITGEQSDYSSGGDHNSTRVYDSDGNLQWSVDQGLGGDNPVVRCLASDDDNNVYAGSDPVETDWNTVRKYDSSGNLLWSFDHTLGQRNAGSVSTPNSICVDSGFVYIGHPWVVR